MTEVDLTTFERLVMALHREMHEVRAGQTALTADIKVDIAGLRAFIAAHLQGVQVALEVRFDQRLERLEGRVGNIELQLRALHCKIAPSPPEPSNE